MAGPPPETLMRLRDIARMHLMFGGDLLRAGRADEAEAYLRAALLVDPALTPAVGLLARALLDLLRADEAIALQREAARREPGNMFHRGTLGAMLLTAGRYREGWAEWAATRALTPRLADPTREWDGRADLRGRTLLVICCDGFGDAFQFCRYIPALTERGARIVLACQAEAAPVLKRLPGVAQTVDRTKPLPRHDLWTEDKILPMRFATEPGNIPLAQGYLAADPDRVAVWTRRLPPGPKIGLVWGGNPQNDQDGTRSLPPGQVASLLRPILAHAGAQCVSFQHGPRRAEAATLPGVLDIAGELGDFGETAAALSCMDLLIGVETATTHLAAALGRPAWVLLSRRPDWRWGLAGEACPWYATARLWRQGAAADWAAVTGAVAAALPTLGLADRA
jgi:tetratricopeptide (TPR) repeat protein